MGALVYLLCCPCSRIKKNKIMSLDRIGIIIKIVILDDKIYYL